MLRNRSGASVVQSAIDIKRWLQDLPSVEAARPSRCLACGAASCLVGGPIALHGHGTRERQVRGPLEPGGPPVLVVIVARRYRCVLCCAVAIVVPRGVQGRHMYSASAIAFALALWGLVLATAAEVRRRVSPAARVGDTAAVGWVTLRRWARDVSRRRLFPTVVDPGPSASLREVAARAATALAACADPTTRALASEHRAFLGAAHGA